MTREEAITTLEKIQKLLAIYPKRKKQKESVNEIDTAIGMAIEALKDRPHGEWLEVHNSIVKSWFCSKCGNITASHTDYCAVCGADMRGDDND